MQVFDKKIVYNFMKLRFASIGLSFILVLGSIVLLLTKGLNYGIDFSGGTLAQVKYNNNAPIEEIRNALDVNELFKGASVTEFGDKTEVVIRFAAISDTLSNDIADVLKQTLSKTGEFEIRRVDIVGPKVGGELRQKGLMAVLVSFALILLYIAIRFEWRFAMAAIISEIHDIVIVMGAISLFSIDVNLDTLAAVLTVLGYSLNDTIIIFDRIRENIKSSKSIKMHDIINESVSSTLSRTTLTSGTTLFTVLILYYFGGEIIHGFSLALIVGVIAGTLSSIFVASPLLMWFNFSVENYRNKELSKQKAREEKEKMRLLYEKGQV
ncbi:protein translocase subunit SecF [Campylobacter canadensis]|uniref:Protein-export membrane protein SecF n=1 Tax=Campylobacter canadensis TaxID=449520 RepID=A0ABS7WPS4_9BACT|nr:protein translocase subunit SecF [Campylobacter canadensis]MBZ7986518.1 protein translocase subunit SecF [Campylobacter canadensis]MBZ7994077.1 protein translocase subunit SecF [Campylobacter canadensis]MBZ7995920.1 protein translocase subunit SecF [Campylobacter canadensis]MBZ7997554.1 protein translocase subunit SecF [Campylobacter canadensis]MBZ7999408.1 protein translocase subunit SecF [Campylobacter canadensis]